MCIPVVNKHMRRLIPLLLSCGKGSNSITAEMVSATFCQLYNLIGSEKAATVLRMLVESFTDTIKVLGGPAVVPQEVSDGLAESLNKQLENMANIRRNRAPIPDGPPAIDFGMPSFDIASLQKFQSKMANLEAPAFDLASLDTDEVEEDMETIALEKMAKLLSYLDPVHPLLQKVTVVQEWGRNRGIKHSDNLLKSVEALVGEFKARYSQSDEKMDCEVGDGLPASLA
jgi:importin-5